MKFVMNLAVLLAFLLLCLAMGLRVQLEDQNFQNKETAVSFGSSLRAQPQMHRLTALRSIMLASVAPVPMRSRMSPKFGRRARASVSMASFMEAFHLTDVVGCMMLGSPGEYQACLALAEPWLKILDNGAIVISEGAKNGLAGGSIATLGAVATVQWGKRDVKERLQCMYCDGTGEIACARCLSTGVLQYSNGDGLIEQIQCPNCKGTGSVSCINCHGTGRSVPEDLFRKLGDREQGFTDDDYVGLLDETGRQPTANWIRD